MLIGLVLGLAVYNAVLLDFPLPIALYRKLLGQPTGLRDLRDMDPPLGRSLQNLLDMGESPYRERPDSHTSCLLTTCRHCLAVRGFQGSWRLQLACAP